MPILVVVDGKSVELEIGLGELVLVANVLLGFLVVLDKPTVVDGVDKIVVLLGSPVELLVSPTGVVVICDVVLITVDVTTVDCVVDLVDITVVFLVVFVVRLLVLGYVGKKCISLVCFLK